MSDDTDKPTLKLVDLSAKRQQLQQGAELQAMLSLMAHCECLRRELIACIDAFNAACHEIPVDKHLDFHTALVRVHGGVSDLAGLFKDVAQGGGDAA